MSTFKQGASISLYISSFFNFKLQDVFSSNLNFRKSQPICAYKCYAYKREWILRTENVEYISANLHKIHIPHKLHMNILFTYTFFSISYSHYSLNSLQR